VPAVNEGGDRVREVGALVNDPANGCGVGPGGEEAGAEGGVGASASSNILDGRSGRDEVNVILRRGTGNRVSEWCGLGREGKGSDEQSNGGSHR
jgi:hypothetical protein